MTSFFELQQLWHDTIGLDNLAKTGSSCSCGGRHRLHRPPRSNLELPPPNFLTPPWKCMKVGGTPPNFHTFSREVFQIPFPSLQFTGTWQMVNPQPLRFKVYDLRFNIVQPHQPTISGDPYNSLIEIYYTNQSCKKNMPFTCGLKIKIWQF